MKAPVIGHLGPRISALLDGQLSPADEERAWDHVHGCHLCRDQVEREGWVKTRLAAMSFGPSAAPASLKGSLLVSGWAAGAHATAEELFELAGAGRPRRSLGLTTIGGGAVGAAVMGVLALGAASPANAPGVVGGAGVTSFGSSLTGAITSIVDRTYGPPVATADRHRPATDEGGSTPFVHVLRRTLVP